jgi:peptide/nickel transport system permease protein
VLKLIAKRLLLAIPTIFIVATFSFGLIKMVPGDPAVMILGQTASQADIEKLHDQLGLNRPVFEQYTTWLGSALRGDLGTSILTGRPVLQELAIALPPTISLAFLTTLISLVVGLALGVLAAVKRGGWDGAIQGISSFGLAIPSFWVAYLLVLAFALTWRIFPATGYTPFNEDPKAWLIGLALPAISIAIGNTCQILLQTRSSVLDILSRDFVRTLQATGVHRSTILAKHVLRNAAIPVAVVTGISFIGVFSGVVVIEAIFNTPGLGNLLLTGVRSADFPMVQGAILFFAILVIVVNLAVDVVTGWLDPRVRV